MGIQLFTNNAASQLSGTLPAGGTTLVCSAGQGSRFPTPTGGDFFYLTIYTKDVYANEQEIEIVKVTARSSDTMTIVRDIEQITGEIAGFAYNGGSTTVYLEMRWTAGCVDNMVQTGEVSPVALSGAYADLSGTPTLGTSSALNVPASGNASSGEVVKGDDSRLTDARTPVAHTHTGDYEPADVTILKDVDIGVTVQAYDADLASWAGIAPAAKQDALVSGTSIKTINSVSLLGSGDIEVAGGGVSPDSIVELTSGTSWTCPAGVTKVRLSMVGGGGGGGKSGATTFAYCGGGGGGGVIAVFSVSPSTSYTYAIGGAGTGATVTGAGGAGGTSSFTANAITYNATGGAGGNNAVEIPPVGGTGSGTGAAVFTGVSGGSGGGTNSQSASGGASIFGKSGGYGTVSSYIGGAGLAGKIVLELYK